MLLLKCLSICDSKYVECVIIFFCSSNQVLDFKQLTTNICHFIKQGILSLVYDLSTHYMQLKIWNESDSISCCSASSLIHYDALEL
jgi:hypothetical protein